MTESPDETAQGAWLDLATKPGFSFLMAHVKYLRDGRYTVERIEEDGQRDSTSMTLLRVRPVRPGAAPAVTTNGTREYMAQLSLDVHDVHGGRSGHAMREQEVRMRTVRWCS